MGTYTQSVNLYKADPVADANDTFNITRLLNDNWDKIDKALTLFDKLMEKYGYTKRKAPDAVKGTKTITVTIGEKCPVAASLVAVFSKVSGDTVVEVTTTIGDNVEKMKHTMSKDGTGKGEKLNG